MRSIGIALISFALTAVVLSNAYYQKKQFYPSVVYITKSNPSMAVIYIQSLVLVLMLGKIMRKIFLGTLRAAEFEHLMERFWYALTETCLAFTVFRDDFNPKFVALFTVLLFLKSFHWLAEDRVDYMERSPLISWLFHVRVASLLGVLAFFDHMMISHAYNSTITKGATVQLVFGFEYAILITMVANTTIKYVLHAAEMRSETPWDNKAVFLLYTELVVGLVRVIFYVLFVIIMVRIYTLPLFAFRPMYYTMRNFKKALNDVILSRRAIRNMNTLYPDATPEELVLSDNICIICREDMVNSSKKLPCGHIFHTACLRSWFQRQQTCPTCRLNILRTPTAAPVNPQANNNPVANNQQNPNENNQNVAANNNGNNLNNNNINNIMAGQNPFANLLGAHGGPFNFGMGPNVPGAFPMMPPPMVGGPFVMPPPLPFMTSYVMPPPPMPASLGTLSDEELLALEGVERKNVEARLKLLSNIQLMLNASVALMNQYNAVVERLPNPPPIPPTMFTAPIIVPTVVTNDTVIPPVLTTVPPIVTEATKSSDDVKIEDLGSEEHLDFPSISNDEPSTSSDSTIITNPIPSTSKLTESIDDTSITPANIVETSELRRRRLQKFLQNEQENKID